MSHFSRIETQMTKKNLLKNALEGMGFTVQEAEKNSSVAVRGFFGEKLTADLKIHAGGNYDIGFELVNGNYQVIGDWDLLPRVANLEKESFTQLLRKNYAKETILEVAKKQNYSVEWAENPETNEIEMVVSQW